MECSSTTLIMHCLNWFVSQWSTLCLQWNFCNLLANSVSMTKCVTHSNRNNEWCFMFVEPNSKVTDFTLCVPHHVNMQWQKWNLVLSTGSRFCITGALACRWSYTNRLHAHTWSSDALLGPSGRCIVILFSTPDDNPPLPNSYSSRFLSSPPPRNTVAYLQMLSFSFRTILEPRI